MSCTGPDEGLFEMAERETGLIGGDNRRSGGPIVVFDD